MSRSHFPSRARRRGQALLLAVLIMIFAALLSASFLAVVSVNLNQTARQTDKNRAVESARAGVDYINRRLTYSSEGDRWFDKQYPAGALASLVASGNNYYSALDRAQGWAGKFAKFPDPRQSTQGDGHQFLARVERIPVTVAFGDPDFEYVGGLKITVIGLSSDDPTAYNRITVRKGGYAHSPLGTTARFVSNWDFQKNVVPAAVADASTTTTLAITNANSDFSRIPVPFTVTLSNPNPVTPVAGHGAVVTAVTGTFPSYSLTLASATSVTKGERIELAANLGAPSGINYSNSLTPTPVPVAVNLSDTNTDLDPTAAATPAPNQVDGARVNGGLLLSGTLNAARLRAATSSFGTTNTVPGTILVSGVIARDNTTTASTATINLIGGTTPDMLKSSDGSGIFTNNSISSASQLVSDAWNRLRGVPSTDNATRFVGDIRPPDFASGESANRYRNMARYSMPAVGYTGELAASYGLGTGIYLDNFQDQEKIYDTTLTPPKLREMTQTELIRMWLSTPSVALPTPADYMRIGTATPPSDLINYPLVSLEQKHLRGWVGPDEFRARGVEIELGNGTITITRDARDDATPMGASPNTTWKDAAGNPRPGVYTETLPWPTTGEIFAEGNVRIKGNALNAPNSLTVVSMGNIYIEDSLSAAPDINADNDLSTPAAQPRKILLMAKKNVVMNPTRIMGRPDVQTINTDTAPVTATVGTPATLNVGSTAGFQVGDVIETTTTTTAAGTVDTVGQIATVSAPSTLMVNVLYSPSSSIAVGSTVRSRNTSVSSAGFGYDKVGGAQDAIQRRFTLPAASANLHMAFAHDADRKPAMTVATEGIPASGGSPPLAKPNSPIYLTNKQVLSPTPPPTFMPDAIGISTENKVIRGEFTEPGTGSPNIFPTPSPTDQPGAVAQTLAVVGPAMDAKQNIDAPNNIGWKYKTTVTAAYNNVPFFYLAGIGNRYDYGANLPVATVDGDIPDWRPLIPKSNIQGNTYEMPLANSISLWLNGTQSAIQSEHYSQTDPAYETSFFGFNPNFVTSGASPQLPEDILTSDQSFYQIDPKLSTLDSRAFGAAPAGSNTLSLRQGDNLIGISGTAPLPDYRMLSVKLEDLDLNASAGSILSIKPRTINVNAFVYAQTGSWFVIPGPVFDTRLRGSDAQTFLDLNANGTPDDGEFIRDENHTATSPWSVGDYADLNRNGFIDETDKHAMVLFSRYNYQINFTGAIAENRTALVNTIYDPIDPTKIIQPGAVADWMDKWATMTYTTTSGTPIVKPDRIHYVFDPVVVANGFQQDDPLTPAVDETDTGFRLPQTTDLFYQD